VLSFSNWGAGYFESLDEWPLARKAFLVSVAAIFLVLYSGALLWLAWAYVDQLTFIDPEVLLFQLKATGCTALVWFLFSLLSAFAPAKYENSPFFCHMPIQFYAFSNSVYGYMLGLLTMPFGIIAFLTGLFFSFLVFGLPPTLWGAATFLILLTGLNFAEQLHLIPYGPLFKSSPVVDGQLSGAWFLGAGTVSAAGLFIASALGLFIVRQLRLRDQILEENREKMLEVNQRLRLAADENEKARDELEDRVLERTEELTRANEKLHSEIEARIRASHELGSITEAMESAVEGMVRVGEDGLIQSANSAFLTMYRESSGAILGTPANDWIRPKDRGNVIRAIMGLRKGKKKELVTRGIRSDGSSFPQEIAFVEHEHWGERGHYRFIRDTTLQTKLSEQLNQALKLDAVGQLAGGVAHDFNNLLMAILTSNEQLQERFGQEAEGSESVELMDVIEMAGKKARDLTARLLDFGRVQPSSLMDFSLAQSIGNMMDLQSSALGTLIEVETDLCADPLPTRGDPARFDSGLLNIALNARDAMADGGRLSIRSRRIRIAKDDPLLSDLASRTTEFARIDVADDGQGIAPENMDKILDPFFTTKPVGKGTGLGLSVFAAYLREIGGAIRVQSTLEVGTTCSIFVPLLEGESEKEVTPERVISLEGSEHILLGEDEEVVARTLKMLLSHSGYRVTRCRNGRELVEAFKASRDELDLVLTDFRMPGLSGADAFAEIKRIDPNFPVILMSGNISLPDIDRLIAQGLRAILRKPCSRRELLSKVRDVLDSGAVDPDIRS
jgi:PAS domain S-box-containing protein